MHVWKIIRQALCKHKFIMSRFQALSDSTLTYRCKKCGKYKDVHVRGMSFADYANRLMGNK